MDVFGTAQAIAQKILRYAVPLPAPRVDTQPVLCRAGAYGEEGPVSLSSPQHAAQIPAPPAQKATATAKRAAPGRGQTVSAAVVRRRAM